MLSIITAIVIAQPTSKALQFRTMFTIPREEKSKNLKVHKATTMPPSKINEATNIIFSNFCNINF